MAWPSVTIDTTNMDAGTDPAGNARAAIKQMADNVNAIKDARGAAGGVARLDSGGKVPSTELPTLPVDKGGTGHAGGYTIGDLLCATAPGTLSKLQAGGSGFVLTSNGPGNAPSYQQAGGVPSGARMVFNMTTPPTGWTKDTNAALNDSILRIVTGTVGAGGSQAFSSWNNLTSTAAHTLTASQLPSHKHNTLMNSSSVGAGTLSSSRYAYATSQTSSNVTNTVMGAAEGAGEAHSHSLSYNLKYNDFIIAQKD